MAARDYRRRRGAAAGGSAAGGEGGPGGGRAADARHRPAASDADPDLAEAAAQDVRPVRRAVPPAAHDRPRRGVVERAPGDVLADRPGARPAQVAGAADAPEEVAVREEVVPGHRPRVAPRGLAEAAVSVELPQAVAVADLVEQAERGEPGLAQRDAVRGVARRPARGVAPERLPGQHEDRAHDGERDGEANPANDTHAGELGPLDAAL